MKKRLILAIAVLGLILGISLLYAQQGGQGNQGGNQGVQNNANNNTTNNTQPKNKIDYNNVKDESSDAQKGTLEQSLYKIAIDTFERAGEWRASMPLEYGIVNIKEIPGAPVELAKKQPEKVQTPPKYGGASRSGAKTYFEEETDAHKQILGIKISFMQRAHSWVRIEPPFPVKLEGMVKGFELWVCGRNKRHTLHLIVKDFYGDEKLLEVGQLNFMGWKKMTLQVPYTITQEDFRFSINRGLTFMGFLITFNPEETSGKYYLYVDNLSAEISRFLEENRDKDDPLDLW